jgi:hypothetical protein
VSALPAIDPAGHARAQSAPSAAGDAAALEWSCNPWRERPGRTALALVLALGMCVLVLSTGVPLLMGGLLCIVLVTALAPSFTAARCRVDDDGVALRSVAGWTRRGWNAIRRARVTPRGLFVSPFTKRHWMDPYRSLFLPFPTGDGAILIEGVRRRLSDHDLAV